MPKSPKSAPPRSNLTLEQHWQIIQYKKEHPTLSTAEIARVFAEKFNHPTLNQSTVSRTLNKEDRLRPFSTHTTRKKISQVRCPEVEEALMKWYSLEIEQGNVVTGPMLRGQAIKIADDMGIPEDQRPKYSNGWLDCYKSRHQLKFGNRPQHSATSTTSTTATTVGSGSTAAAAVQTSQVQVPPHLQRAAVPTPTPSALSTLSILAAASPRSPVPYTSTSTHSRTHSASSSPLSPYYSSPPMHLKSDPDAIPIDVDVDEEERDVSPESDIDTYSDSNSNSYPSSNPSRSPSCCSYGYAPSNANAPPHSTSTLHMGQQQERGYGYNGYPSPAPSSYPGYPSYTSNGYAYRQQQHTASATTSPYTTTRTSFNYAPTSPLSTSRPHLPPLRTPSASTTGQTSAQAPAADDSDITHSIKKLRLHLESCPGLAGREVLLRNMEAIECAVSDCRSSIEPDVPRHGSHSPSRHNENEAGAGAGLGAVVARGGEQIEDGEIVEGGGEGEGEGESQCVSVPPQRRQRWLDLVTSPTDSDYSASSSVSVQSVRV